MRMLILFVVSFAANGKSVDATQELLAIGASNIANSFVQGFPGTGSLSRGAVNNASGVRTPMGSLYTGVLVILALQFMTPLFFYIPKAALASIIIAAVIFMVEVRVVMPMWRRKSTFASATSALTSIHGEYFLNIFLFFPNRN